VVGLFQVGVPNKKETKNESRFGLGHFAKGPTSFVNYSIVSRKIIKSKNISDEDSIQDQIITMTPRNCNSELSREDLP